MDRSEPKYALTGATGFIGRSVVKGLIARQSRVRVMVRSKYTVQGVETVSGDLADPDALSRLAEGSDIFIHLAGLTKAASLKALLKANAEGAANAARAARKAGAKRFILVSSLVARVAELSDYARSKRAGETAAEFEKGDMEFIIVRPPAIIGPGDKATEPMIKALKRGVLPVPAGVYRKNRLSFVHVEDMARYLIELARQPNPESLIEPCGGTHSVNWDELAAIAGEARGQTVRPIPLPVFLLKSLAQLNQSLLTPFGASSFVNPGKIRELLHPDWAGRTFIPEARTLRKALEEIFTAELDDI